MSAGAAGGARVVADTHVHLYPAYDIALALASLAANLARTPAGACAGFFAERHGCQAFDALRDGAAALSRGGLRIDSLPDAGALLLTGTGVSPVYLFAGRQIVTAERIEVLALAVDLEIADGLPSAEVVERVLATDGVPVLGWSPGKWLFSRGGLVRALLERFGNALLLGDTALRPALSPEPSLMREARRRGIGVIAGTDPLPFPGEERLLGSYASVFAGSIDPERPVASARRLLRSLPAGTAGARGTWTGAARRWLHNTRLKRPPSDPASDSGGGGAVTGGRVAEREGTWASAPERPHQGRSALFEPAGRVVRFERRGGQAQVERAAGDRTAPPRHRLPGNACAFCITGGAVPCVG